MAIACVDGGLVCVPLLLALLGSLFGWLFARCRHHDHCDH